MTYRSLWGGVIPERDGDELQRWGIKGVFRTGASLSGIVDFMRECGQLRNSGSTTES